ncbi:hypothetical protein D3C81_1777120 [compost metagenome]
MYISQRFFTSVKFIPQPLHPSWGGHAVDKLGLIVVTAPRAVVDRLAMMNRVDRDVAAGVAGANDQDPLALDAFRRPVIDRMHDIAGEMAAISRFRIAGLSLHAVADQNKRIKLSFPRR